MNIIESKTILIVAPYFPPYGGGLERYAFEISRRLLREHGWRVIVITSGIKKGHDTQEEMEGMTVHRLTYSFKISNTPFSFRWYGKIKKIIKAENPDIINIHTPVPGIGDIAALAAKGKPIVVTYHAGSMRKHKIFVDICIWLYEHFFMQCLLKRAVKIACPSDFVRLNFLGKFIYKSVTITPAVDTSVFKLRPERKTQYPSILFVAGLNRADQHKGLQYLLEAMSELRKKISNIHLIVVGEGGMRSEYEQRVKNLGLEEAVVFTGRLSGEKLAEQYQCAHFFVLPTLNESFSMVILEAMASGLPVVSTNVGGVPTLVSNNETGFLVEAGDGPAVTQKILELIENSQLAADFGNKGRNKVLAGFDWGRRAEKYHEIFLQILSKAVRNNKIAIVTPYFYPRFGGLENYALEMARALKEDNKDVFIITSNHIDKGRRYEEIEGMRIYRLPSWFKISNTPINPGWLWEIKKIFKNERPDLVNAHTPVPYMADIAERARGKIPFLLNYHNDLTKADYFLNLLCELEYKFLTNKTLRQADGIIATSEYYALHSPYLKPVLKKIKFVPPGVDTKRFKPGIPTPYFSSRFAGFRTIIFVGQLDKTHAHKGLDDLLAAVAKIKQVIPKIKLIVVGGGDNLEHYRERARSLGIADDVNFAGFVTNELLPEYYAGADVFALPSRDQSEGFGMVATEAAACGTPAVATTVGGIPAAVVDGLTGLLVPPSNIKELTAALEKILLDAPLAEKLGEQASQRAEREFSLPIVTQKFIKIVDDVIKENNQVYE
jgi:glycosyltransferase involved in cell wall biosynthesis